MSLEDEARRLVEARRKAQEVAAERARLDEDARAGDAKQQEQLEQWLRARSLELVALLQKIDRERGLSPERRSWLIECEKTETIDVQVHDGMYGTTTRTVHTPALSLSSEGDWLRGKRSVPPPRIDEILKYATYAIEGSLPLYPYQPPPTETHKALLVIYLAFVAIILLLWMFLLLFTDQPDHPPLELDPDTGVIRPAAAQLDHRPHS